MEQWFRREHLAAYGNQVLPDGKWRLCLAMLVYGNYVERFLRLCVPSLLAPGNISALFDPLIIIHTDAASFDAVDAGVEPLRKFARVEIYLVPQNIVMMAGEDKSNRYWLLSATDQLHMQQAKYRAHGFHMLMPDLVYAKGFFANLARLAVAGKSIIVQNVLSTRLEKVEKALAAVDHCIDPEELNALALDYLHPLFYPNVMNGKKDFPQGLLLLMVGKSAVHIISPHMSIFYFAHEHLMNADIRLFNTIDSQLPYLVPKDVEPYVPSANDGMALIEVSDRHRVLTSDKSCSLLEYCARFWMVGYCELGYARFSGLTSVLPLPKDYHRRGRRRFLPDRIKPMSDAKIAQVTATVRSALRDNYEALVTMMPEELRSDPLERVRREAAQAG